MTNQSCPWSNQGNRRVSSGVPLVSIGMPVYNGERFVRQALESILIQDYGNFELIISDNASTDATSKICRRYADRDARVRYVRNETNLGASPNHKRVFEMGTGDYFKWAAHDDECLPTFLSRCMSVFGEAPQSVVLVYPQSLIIAGKGEWLGSSGARKFSGHVGRSAEANFRTSAQSVEGVGRSEGTRS
jgi:glycosyltransferase involved in cell wall biosynthesis